MPLQALAAVATLISFARHGDRIDLRLDHGAAELTWVSPRTFRFRRVLEGPLSPLSQANRETVDVKIEETPAALRLRSKYLDVSIQKRGALATVERFDGEPIMKDLSEPRGEEASISWERAMRPGTRFYGLGRRAGVEHDWRGQAAEAETPFLVSTDGYGEYHNGDGTFRFDFTAPDRYRIQAPRMDYYFFYGPTPKEIFEERNNTRAPGERAVFFTARAGGWEGLRAALLALTHGAMAGMLSPAFDFGPYAGAAPDLLLRARQMGSLVPDVSPGQTELTGWRNQLATFFSSYGTETRDKGYPMWHPLPFEFPEDPECAHHADEFLLGDEMLIAPIVDASGRRSVYLPRGVWTNLETNQVEQGRRTVTVETKSLPVFARNGTIVPLDSPAGMGLHYFPTLPAEFFLLETGVADWSQAHAAPAADIFRLEIQSKVSRDYQWVVHHVERPAEIGFEERRYAEVTALSELANFTWFYDAVRKNLHVRTHAGAGETGVIHVSWKP